MTQRPNPVASSGQNLMRITLVTNIKDQLVVRRVKNRMDRNGQFHHTKARPQMAARIRNRRNRLRAQLVRYRRQFAIRHFAQITGEGHPIKSRGHRARFGFRRHCLFHTLIKVLRRLLIETCVNRLLIISTFSEG